MTRYEPPKLMNLKKSKDNNVLSPEQTINQQRKKALTDIQNKLKRLAKPIFNADVLLQKQEEKKFVQNRNEPKPVQHLEKGSIAKLKDSTKKLICLLEEIQSKIQPKNENYNQASENLTDSITYAADDDTSLADLIGHRALARLEEQAKEINEKYIELEKDDCTIYKKLIRKCHCLTSGEYNDLVIHFNENTTCYTNTLGEIIKNMKIVKKFLYMDGAYSKRALAFLNEGFNGSTHMEKVEIIQGSAYADICNIFEDRTIVTYCLSWPCKYEVYGDATTQDLAAKYLHRLAEIEEGRRYLKFNSRITNDLKKLLRKKAIHLDPDVLESVTETLNLMHPIFPNHEIVSYYNNANVTKNEGFATLTTNKLIEHREFMTLDEVFIHLQILNNVSNTDDGRIEMANNIIALVRLFKYMMVEYDNSEMNIIITNILNNVVARVINVKKHDDEKEPSAFVSVDATTEPVKMKHVMQQMPALTPKKHVKKYVFSKSKSGLGSSPTLKFRRESKQKVPDWASTSNFINRSKKFFIDEPKSDPKKNVIHVPLET